MWEPALEFIADSLNGNGNIDWNTDFEKYDLNGDGVLDAGDCPFPHGSAEAKLWWKNLIETQIVHEIPQEFIDQYGDAVVGVYKGKPLVPGEAGQGQGDFQFLVDSLRINSGLSYGSAVKVAGKVNKFNHG